MDRIMNEFPNCIECSGNYLSETRTHYFHKNDCKRGLGLDKDELIKRIDERYLRLKPILYCSTCGEVATGEIVVKYHGKEAIVERWYVCLNHAFHEDRTGRKSEYKSIGGTK